MTKQATSRCGHTNCRTGVRCDAPGTVDPKRWHGCLCTAHAEAVAYLSPALLPALIASLKRRKTEQKQAA